MQCLRRLSNTPRPILHADLGVVRYSPLSRRRLRRLALSLRQHIRATCTHWGLEAHDIASKADSLVEAGGYTWEKPSSGIVSKAPLLLQEVGLDLLDIGMKLGKSMPQQRELPRDADDFKPCLATSASALQAGRGIDVISDRLDGYSSAPLGVLYTLVSYSGALLAQWSC